MAAHVELSFFLRGVDPQKIISDYKAGRWSRPCPLPMFNESEGSTADLLAPVYTDNPLLGVFTVKDRRNVKLIYAGDGQADFEHFLTTGGNLLKGGRCRACLHDYEHEMPGFIVKHEEQICLDPTDWSNYTVHVFWFVPEAVCSFECLYWRILEQMSTPLTSRKIPVDEAIKWLKMLYRLIYPNEPPLVARSNPSLLAKQSLEYTEYHNKKHRYVPTGRIMMIPSRPEYLRQQLG